MSVSDGLVGNIVLSTRLLPMDVDGLLPSTLLIYDGFLCCCNELWLSLIAIFFVVTPSVDAWTEIVAVLPIVRFGANVVGTSGSMGGQELLKRPP